MARHKGVPTWQESGDTRHREWPPQQVPVLRPHRAPPLTQGSPWLPDETLQAASFPKAEEPGRATWKQLPSGKERGGDGEGPATAGMGGGGRRTLPCPAERAGLRGWGSRMGRPRCGIQGSTQRSRLEIKSVLVPFVTKTLALNKPLHTCEPPRGSQDR